MGGVATLSKMSVEEPHPRTANFKQAIAEGRAQLTYVYVHDNILIPIFNIYGHPNGHHDRAKAEATDRLIQAVAEEQLMHQGPAPNCRRLEC